MQLLGALAWSATMRLANRRDCVHGLLQDLRVVDVCGCVDHTERDAFSVDHNGGASSPSFLYPSDSAGLVAPPGAATLAESNDALCQSISSAWPKRSKSLWCSFSHTPASRSIL